MLTFHVPTAARLKMMAISDIAPCSLKYRSTSTINNPKVVIFNVLYLC
jgi:hypothetical protein